MTPTIFILCLIVVACFAGAAALHMHDQLTRARRDRDRALDYAGRIYRAINKGPIE